MKRMHIHNHNEGSDVGKSLEANENPSVLTKFGVNAPAPKIYKFCDFYMC